MIVSRDALDEAGDTDTLRELLTAVLARGNGATFQLVPHRWKGKTGLMTGIIGAAGGIGGFYLPVVMGIAKESTGSYQRGFTTFGILAALAFALVVILHRQWLAWSAPETTGLTFDVAIAPAD